MRKLVVFFSVIFTIISGTVSAFGAQGGSEGAGKTPAYIIGVILLICAVIIYLKRKG